MKSKLITFILLCIPFLSFSQTETSSVELFDLSLDELLNIEITSVSKSDETTVNVHAAVDIITNQMIRERV